MPVKLPAPLFGTEAQPGPKSDTVLADAPPPAATADDDGIADEEAGAAAVLDEPELHAAAPRAMLAAIPDTASRRTFFTVFSLMVLSLAGVPVRLSVWLTGRHLRFR
jgi:hypothetical protein